MDQSVRNGLLERRRMLQLRHQRQSFSRRFRAVGRQLCEARVPFSKSVPTANEVSLGRLVFGPGQDEELHFDWMDNAVVRRFNSAEAMRKLLSEAIAACAHPFERVTVIWHPAEAGLRMRACDVANHAGSILVDTDWTTWIVASEPSDWLIQVGERSGTIAYSEHVPVYVVTADDDEPSDR